MKTRDIIVAAIIIFLFWRYYKNRPASQPNGNGTPLVETCGDCVDRLLEDRNYNPETALLRCCQLGCDGACDDVLNN
jgi:hypothetical protein